MKTIEFLEQNLTGLIRKMTDTQKAIELLRNFQENPDVRYVADIPTAWPSQCPVVASDSDPYHACTAVWKLFEKRNKRNGLDAVLNTRIHLFVRLAGDDMFISLSHDEACALIKEYCEKNKLPNPMFLFSINPTMGIFRRTPDGKEMPNLHYASRE